APSAAAGVDRRAGAALRLLPERHDDPGGRSAGDDEETDRVADPHGHERPPLSVRHVSPDPDRDPEGRCRGGEGRHVAVTGCLKRGFSRRTCVRGGGAPVVGFTLAGAGLAGRARAATAPSSAGYLPAATQVDSYLTVNPDNPVTFRTS